MIRAKTSDPWREVSWEEALTHTAREFRRIQQQYGTNSIGAIVSSRCTNEEDYLVQKLVRAAFGNNNVDTCARVCHSPTGYGLKQTLGESAGTQTFKSVELADVIVVIGANPSEAHPVFASRLKRRVREGARLIVIDPRAIDLVGSPHVRADHHLQLKPGTNVAVLSAMAHVIVTEGLVDEAFVAARCEAKAFADWREFVARAANSPEALEAASGVPAAEARAAARLYAKGWQCGDLLRPRRHRAFAGLDRGDRHRQPGHGHRQPRPRGRRRQSAARAEQRAGFLRHGKLPARTARLSPCFRHDHARAVRARLGRDDPARAGAAHSQHVGCRARWQSFLGLYCQGEDPAQSDPNTTHVTAALAAMECVVVQDLFLNETAKYAHVFLPGASFLEKDGTFTNAERRISRVRRVMPPLAGMADWEVTMALAKALGYAMHYEHPGEIMDEIARLTPTFAGVSYDKLERAGSLQWPCNDEAPEWHADHACRSVRAWQGAFPDHPVRADRRKGDAPLPAAADHRPRALAVQRWRTNSPYRQHRLLRGRPAGDSSPRCRGAWHPRRRPGEHRVARRPHHAAGDDHRASAAGRGLHHLPFPGIGSQRRSPPTTPTGPPTAPSTRSLRCNCRGCLAHEACHPAPGVAQWRMPAR
jgi:formate dehydrogenase major subunit